MQKVDKKTLEMLVLMAYGYEEISIGRACELLGWPKFKVEKECLSRCRKAKSLTDHIKELELDNSIVRDSYDDLEKKYKHLRIRFHHFMDTAKF